MKSVIMSINNSWIYPVISGQISIIIRPTIPDIEPPFRVYIYENKDISRYPLYIDKSDERLLAFRGRGKIVAEFICRKIIDVDCDSCYPFDKKTGEYINQETGYNRNMFWRYCGPLCGFGLVVSDLKVYDSVLDLNRFYVSCEEDCQNCEYYKYVRVNPSEYDFDCTSENSGYRNGYVPLVAPIKEWAEVRFYRGDF